MTCGAQPSKKKEKKRARVGLLLLLSMRSGGPALGRYRSCTRAAGVRSVGPDQAVRSGRPDFFKLFSFSCFSFRPLKIAK
jgi:hypothetical protein